MRDQIARFVLISQIKQLTNTTPSILKQKKMKLTYLGRGVEHVNKDPTIKNC